MVRRKSAPKRCAASPALFLDGAPNFNDDHVALFDDVIGCLIEEIEAKALAELARKLAPVPNAPEDVVRTLAKNDDIAVAGPVLQKAKLDDPELKYIAETKSQAHLLALSGASRHRRSAVGNSGRARRPRGGALDRHQSKCAAVGKRLHHAGHSAPSRTVCWRKKSACAPIFRRACSASF